MVTLENKGSDSATTLLGIGGPWPQLSQRPWTDSRSGRSRLDLNPGPATNELNGPDKEPSHLNFPI